MYLPTLLVQRILFTQFTLPCLWNIIQLMQYYPSKYDPLHVKKSYSTPKLVVEITLSAAKHPFFPVICRHNFKTPPSKADDVICERPLLAKLSNKTGRNQKI